MEPTHEKGVEPAVQERTELEKIDPNFNFGDWITQIPEDYQLPVGRPYQQLRGEIEQLLDTRDPRYIASARGFIAEVKKEIEQMIQSVDEVETVHDQAQQLLSHLDGLEKWVETVAAQIVDKK